MNMINNSVVTGGTYYMAETINNVTLNSSGALKVLTDAASPSAFHNSGSRYDPPKCHENTRVAVLKRLMNWVVGCDLETREKWIMWLYGGAGAGKSAIAQTLAEKCDKEGRLLASFFFGRSDPTRNNAKSLIPTIACQIYERVPSSRKCIISAIKNDPLILNKTLLVQFDSLVMKPLMKIGKALTRNLIIIDGLDECVDRASQMSILSALFDAVNIHSCRIRFLVASRPEHDILTTFSLQSGPILARLVLDNKYHPEDDIRLFLNDKIQGIKESHPFRHLIPWEWPGAVVVCEIVEKSSGQFIYASTVIKFIKSNRHRPDHRLEIVRNLRAPQGDMPFAELDALYTHMLSSVEDVPTVMEVLSFVLLWATQLDMSVTTVFVEKIHDLEPGSLQLILCDLGALVVISECDTIKVLHASLLDFLLDPSRTKGLPISGDMLITKHVTNVLRFLSKNTLDEDDTGLAVYFLLNYLNHVTLFNADMARAFDGFSLIKFYQEATLTSWIKDTFLKYVSPALSELMRQSDQHEFLLRYLTLLDESYLTLMDNYPPKTLALQISTMLHDDVFPCLALDLPFQLLPFREEDDFLVLNCFGDYTEENIAATVAHRNVLRQFLLDPNRSKHHNFQSFAPQIYATALLGCFYYLKKIIVSPYSTLYETWLNEFYPYSSDMASKDLTQESNQETTQSNRFEHENKANSQTVHSQDGDMNANQDTGQVPLCGAEEHYKVDTEKDIQAWKDDWNRKFGHEPRRWSWAPSKDLETLWHRMESKDFQKVLRARYYLMLGYMIYFFPRAGESEELITLCKTVDLWTDSNLFPEHTDSAQCAMTAYIKRMTMTTDNNDINIKYKNHASYSS